MLPIRHPTEERRRKTALKLALRSVFVGISGFWMVFGTPKYTATNAVSVAGTAKSSRKLRQPVVAKLIGSTAVETSNSVEKKALIISAAAMLATGAPASMYPVALGRRCRGRFSPKSVNVMAVTITVPMVSTGKNICMASQLGDRMQPTVPTAMAVIPKRRSFLWLNLTLNALSRMPKVTAASVERVTNWLPAVSKGELPGAVKGGF